MSAVRVSLTHIARIKMQNRFVVEVLDRAILHREQDAFIMSV